MHLVIFDIDGTLTQTYEADGACYVQALREVFAFTKINTDWASYRHATDSGIFQEICECHFGRIPAAAEIARFRRHFVGLLTQASLVSPFSAIRGAPLLLARLACSPEHRVALATGAWSDSARLKMATAGMRYDDYPAASSDDAIDRESIIRVAAERATERYGGFENSIYIGDGVWDARACRKLAMPFIGIAKGDRASRLLAEGAICVFPDFSDADLFLLRLLEITNAT